jgi:hypothetical protein
VQPVLCSATLKGGIFWSAKALPALGLEGLTLLSSDVAAIIGVRRLDAAFSGLTAAFVQIWPVNIATFNPQKNCCAGSPVWKASTQLQTTG